MKALCINLEKPARFSRLIYNLLPAGMRMDTLEGKDYLVVPMVILTEGVHSGSMGALYYPAEELSKTPAAWNYKPIVVYHPTLDGESITACEPNVLNTRKVGVMMNTRFEDGKLKSEAWIDKSRAGEVDPRIMKAIDSAQMMELSTGVFIDIEGVEGDWKGEKYMGIARNYRPDHLALLPDQIGACSIADGAGFIRNQRRHPTEKQKNNMDKTKTVEAIIAANLGWAEADREALMALNENQLTLIQNSLKKEDKKDEKAEKPAPTDNKVETPKVETPKVETPKAETPKVVTVNDYIGAAPREIAEVLNSALAMHNSEKQRIVDTLLKNENNSFTKEQLEARPLEELKALAKLAGVQNKEARYDGQGVAQNAVKAGNEEPVLELPVMNFGK